MKHTFFHKAFAAAFLLLLWIAAAAFTVMTDKDLVMGGHGKDVRLTWEALEIPWNLVTNQYSGLELVATLISLMIFAAYIVLSILIHFKQSKALYSLTMIIIAIDGIANFQFFRGFEAMPPVFQYLATGLVFITLVYFGPKGLELAFESFGEIGVRKGRDNEFD